MNYNQQNFVEFGLNFMNKILQDLVDPHERNTGKRFSIST